MKDKPKCPWCHADAKEEYRTGIFENEKKKARVVVGFYGGTMRIELKTEDIGTQSVAMPINNCPICGRAFTDAEKHNRPANRVLTLAEVIALPPGTRCTIEHAVHGFARIVTPFTGQTNRKEKETYNLDWRIWLDEDPPTEEDQEEFPWLTKEREDHE